MLVLSRRPDEKVVFPGIHITVQVLPVPGEKNLTNNKSVFPAIFTH